MTRYRANDAPLNITRTPGVRLSHRQCRMHATFAVPPCFRPTCLQDHPRNLQHAPSRSRAGNSNSRRTASARSPMVMRGSSEESTAGSAKASQTGGSGAAVWCAATARAPGFPRRRAAFASFCGNNSPRGQTVAALGQKRRRPHRQVVNHRCHP